MPDDLLTKRQPFDSSYFVERGNVWFFNTALTLFILSLLVWGGAVLFQRSLNANAAGWRAQVETLEQELRPDLINQLVGLSNRVNAAREIISGHVFTSNALSVLEQNTHPRVSFTSFQYSSDGRRIELSAKAGSYRAVAEQVTLFEAENQIESVNFGGLSLDERGFVNFKLTLIIKPSLIKLRPK